MKKFLKWASIACLTVGIIVGGIGILKGGLNEVDFLYWIDVIKSIKIF